MNQYKYKLISTNESSQKYGNCEVCGNHVTEVFHQIEEEYFNTIHNGEIYEGWMEGGSLWGHENCLKSMQK